MFKWATFAVSLLLYSSAYAADEPQWLKDARARESKLLRATEIRSQDGWLKLTTPGKSAQAIEKVDGSYSIELDIGADARVYCEVYPKGVDLANALRLTFNNAVKNFEESQGKVSARALESSDAGAHGAVPYIALAWVYRIAGPKGDMLGGFKQFVMEKGEHAAYCALNELGYTKTFTAITKAFAETLQTQDVASAPQYIEIHTASMAGRKVGVAVTTMRVDSEGDTRAKQMTAMLLAIGDDAVHAQDTREIEWVRPDGTLINAASSTVTNGEHSTDLELKEVDGVWTAEGEMDGKAVKAALPKDAQPGNSILQARQVRALLAQAKPVGLEHTINLWMDENPGTLTESKTKVLSRQSAERFLALAKQGDMTANLTLDKVTGLPAAAEIKMGPLELKLERVYANGSF
jgi:hypothetical protein